jgi:hypothetical protein
MLDSYQPFLEADLGRGHLIRLSQRRLEWVGGRGGESRIVKIEDLRSVSLAERPVWEALLVGILLAGGFALGFPWEIRLLLAGLILLSLIACFAQKRYALTLQLRSGQVLEIALGTGTKRAAQTQRVRSVWATLSAELRSLGVATVEPPTT